jgi:predicted Zn-dependent protease
LRILTKPVILSEAKILRRASFQLAICAGRQAGSLPYKTMKTDRITKALELHQRFPDNDLSRFNLTQAYFDSGDYANAIEHLRALCAKKPDWMVVHIQLGKALLAVGEAQTAKPILEHALQLAVAQHHDTPREELEELLKTL